MLRNADIAFCKKVENTSGISVYSLTKQLPTKSLHGAYKDIVFAFSCILKENVVYNVSD